MNTPGLLSFLALALAAAPAFAHSMQVLSSGEEARRCSDAAQMASTIGGASRTDLEDCNRALVTVVLRQRDRAATLVTRGILESALGDQDAAMASYDKALVVMPAPHRASSGCWRSARPPRRLNPSPRPNPRPEENHAWIR